MAQAHLVTAVRAPRATSVHLPLFLVPSFASNNFSSTTHSHRPRTYASHASTPHPNPDASRKHLKPDFPLNTLQHKREKNKKRGVSAIRSTGPRVPLSISRFPLPVPEKNPVARKQFPTNPNHGLWGFFYENKKSMSPPEEQIAHGRAWTYAELTVKSFEDLHALFWVCHKERNRITTNSLERTRVHAGYGDAEDETRSKTVSETMKNIRDVLRDRYWSTEDALRILDSTPLAELNLDDAETDRFVEDDEYYAEDQDSEPARSRVPASGAEAPPAHDSNQR